MIIFFLVAMGILSLGYSYMGARLILPAELPSPWNWIAWVVIVIFLLIPPISIYLQMKRIDNTWTHILMWVGYISMGFFSFVFTIVVIRDLVWLLFFTTGKVIGAPTSVETIVDPDRRLFLMRAMSTGVVALAAAMTGIGFFEARKCPGIIEVDVPLPQLPPEFEGFRIVQISDIHAGLTVGRSFIETVAGQVIALKPDMIAFTGDVADGSVAHLQNIVTPLGDMTAPYGKFFVTGNHEYYSGVEQWLGEATRLGFTPLLNEHRVIEKQGKRMLLAGVTDVSGGHYSAEHRSSPGQAVIGAPACDVKVLLAHQPRSLYEAVKFGFDLQLSGHTHGGQFFPWNLAASLGQPFISGLHKFENTMIYVSKGTGYWGPPVRLGSRSEITVLRLTRNGTAPTA
jgi:uncharacterized protein